MRYALLNNRNKSITIIKQVTGKINVSVQINVESLKKNLEKKIKCTPSQTCERRNHYEVLACYILSAQLQSPFVLILQVSRTLLEGWKTILTEDFPSFGALMVVLESPNI